MQVSYSCLLRCALHGLTIVHFHRLLLALEPGIIPAKYTKPAKMPFKQVNILCLMRDPITCTCVLYLDGDNQRVY